MNKLKDTEIGQIPVEWRIVPLPSVIQTVIDNRGKTVPTIESEDGFPLIATNCIKEQGLFPIKENLRYLTQETYENWFRGHPEPGDIIIVNKGTPGLVCYVPDPVDFCIAQDMVAVRIKDAVYNKYIFAYLRSRYFKYQVNAHSVGTTIPHLKKSSFNSLLIPIPSSAEQRIIGDIYFDLSSKIELLQRQNQTLEKIAQTLFKHWFIDFEFPNEDGKSYRSSGGAMQASEFGEVPVGWSTTNLGEVASIKHGYAFKGEFISTEESNYVLLTPGNFKIGGGFKWSKFKYYVDDLFPEEYFLNYQDLIVTMTDLSKDGDTLGYPAFVPKIAGKKLLHNQRLGKFLINSEEINMAFLYQLLKTREYRWHVLGSASGSTVRHTSPSRIGEFEFVLPTSEVMNLFGLTISNLFLKIGNNEEQIQTLTKARDTLLPKLMNGQIRIEELEKYTP
jgi:type I restriction enzyme S subunit